MDKISSKFVSGKDNLVKLVLSIAIPVLVGMTSGFFTDAQSEWYLGLQGPFFQPPGWLISIVWITLYILMGIAFYMIWKKGFSENKKPIALFSIQLAINFSWSFVFFTFQSLWGGLIVMLIMLFFVVWTAWEFYKVSKKAGYLFIPYIVWIFIAMSVNIAFIILN